MIAKLAATLSVPATCSLSATLTKTAAPSGGIVTSDTVTVNVPPGSSGQLTFTSFSITGTIATEYSDNGAAFAVTIGGETVTFTNGETLAVRMTGASAGESWTFTLRDETRAVNIGTYTLTAS